MWAIYYKFSGYHSGPQYKIDCRVTIELLDTESDETEKSVTYAQEWSTYVEKYTGQNNGPSTAGGQFGESKTSGESSSSPMDTLSMGETGSGGGAAKSGNGEGGGASGGGKDSSATLGKKSKTHGSCNSEEAVSFTKSTSVALTSSLSSGAPPSSTTNVISNTNSNNISSSGSSHFHNNHKGREGYPSVQGTCSPSSSLVGSGEGRSIISGGGGAGGVGSSISSGGGGGVATAESNHNNNNNSDFGVGSTLIKSSGVSGGISGAGVLMKNTNKCNKAKMMTLIDGPSSLSVGGEQETCIRAEKDTKSVH